MSGLELLGSGREADVYRLDGERALRRYRDGYDVAQEAEIMAYVGAFGYPVPTVYDVDGPDLVMELLDGPTMAAALEAADLELPAGATMLADLHDRLHALPARSPDRDGDRVIHLDLHPENVLLVARGPVVIDWRNATDGPPDFDLALSAIKKIRTGGVIVNGTSRWRNDQMPYGGVKDSGLGREGPKFSIRDMTEERFFVLN